MACRNEIWDWKIKRGTKEWAGGDGESETQTTDGIDGWGERVESLHGNSGPGITSGNKGGHAGQEAGIGGGAGQGLSMKG